MDSDNIRILDIPTTGGSNVRVDAYLPPAGKPLGIVILCHGFKGHRRWGFLPELSRRLSDAGFAALAMDFSHNGYDHFPGGGRPGEHNHFDPEIFSKNTISRECIDLSDVIRYISTSRLDEGIPQDAPIGLYGHSRGALAVILHALEMEECQAICTWATTSNPNFYTNNQKESWRRNGFLKFTDSKNGSSLALDVGYLDDLEANSERFRLLDRVPHLHAPHLLVHGTMDLVVPAKCSENIYLAERDLQDRHMVLLKTGHTFGFTEESNEFSHAFEIASEETVRWFRKYLTIRS
jgi:dienelactone hydrolase